MFGIKTKIKYALFRLNWIKKKSQIIPMNYFSKENVHAGKYSYGELNVVSFNNKSQLFIGNYVSIAQNVSFLLDADHNITTVSSYPFRTKILKKGDEAISKGDIVVDDDVWIGYGATILSGVHIGQGAVVAAGAVVTKDVEPYVIVGGVPAKTIKYRFDQTVINYLLTLDYNNLDEDLIHEHIDDLYTPIEDKSLEEITRMYDWFPKRA